MPRVHTATMRSVENKENDVPARSGHRHRRAEDGVDQVGEPRKEKGRAPKDRHGSSSSAAAAALNGSYGEIDDVGKNAGKHERSHKSSSSSITRTKRRADDEEDEVDGKRHRSRLDLAQELEEVQAQFDELRQLRMTEPERILAEWQAESDRSNRETEEYIAALKRRLEKGREDNSTSTQEGLPGGDHSTWRKQLQECQAREADLREENAKQARELQALRLQTGQSTSSLAFRAGIGSGHMLGAGDERAVRRLYEDLTGMVVNKVERTEGREDFRRFHAIFACAGYHDLEIKLDESTSDLPSSVSTTGGAGSQREDLVYTPSLDEDRDAELLESGRLPAFLKDSIRFERATAVKFLSTLHKRLDRHAKR